MKWSFSGAGLAGVDGIIIDIVVVVVVIITSSMTIALIVPVGIVVSSSRR